ncbi:MAG: polysaccharide deacetylase family protein [Acidimicrobiales bacterium]|nr:polysaccharide deacetylase family protein [Acidimicrobiales bacterium]MYI13405.1 polysaccharide deacetylase family protein [Acidimicrobiales bacterium]
MNDTAPGLIAPLPGSLAPHRVRYLPITDRPRIRWPNDARVALWIAPNVEHYEFLPPRDPQRNTWTRSPHPDVQGYGYRDYGNRVGFWRMAEVLDRFGVVATASTNLAVFDHYPEVGAAMVERGWEIMSHGIYNTRYISSIDETAERAFYIECIEALRSHTGQQLRGMLGPAVSNTAATPDLMAEAGLIYHADWFHDDQPVPLATRSGQQLVSVPYSMELNDVPVFTQHFDTSEFVAMAKAQLDVLRREADDDAGGRVMCVALHPYLMGMPHRVDGLAAMLDYLMSHDDVWQTTASQIAQHFLDHHYDNFVAHEPESPNARPKVASTGIASPAGHAQGSAVAGDPAQAYEFGPAQHQHGMDHPYYDWSPLPSRPRFEWPDRSPLAVGAVVVLEHVEWEPPPDAYSLRRRSGGLARLPTPDYPQLTIREYGHRVGIFRLLELLERHGVAATIAMDALTAEHYGWLAAHLVERECEIAGRGIAATRLITSKNSEADERAAIARSLDAIESATGIRPTTWFSAEGVESFRTPALLAEAGIDTVLDWPNDEQPVLMATEGVLAGVGRPDATPPMVSLPLFLEADDEFALWHRRVPLDGWREIVTGAAARMHRDGAEHPAGSRLLMLTLRPWLAGQPFRVPTLDTALGRVMALGNIHTATASELAVHARSMLR